MKRYLVFADENYYPSGGWGDFKQSFDDLEAAKQYADSIAPKWDSVDVIDLEVEKSVYSLPPKYTGWF